MRLKFVCQKFSDFENLHKAPKQHFFFKTYFSIILSQKPFFLNIFKKISEFFNFHHEIHEKQQKFMNEKIPLH